MSQITQFTDNLGQLGRENNTVIVPTCDETGFPQLATARVVQIVVREPSPFASELSVRVRLDDPADQESRIYEPDEVVVTSIAKEH